MKQIAEKLRNLERQAADEKGPFSLFGLFLREDAPDKWDLVVSAPWIDDNNEESLAYIAESLRAFLAAEELLNLSRIVLVEQSNPGLEAVQRAMHVEHGVVELKDCNFFGLEIKSALIITSQRLGEPVTQSSP